MADYSGDHLPGGRSSCETCHQTTTGATQQANMYTPNRAACGSCHDDVNFATGANHVNLPQVSDNQCADCHKPKGETDFDASIAGAHLIPRFSQNLPGVTFKIIRVTGNKPGGNVTVEFTVLDKKGNGVALTDLTRLNLLLTGPNTDYAFPGMAAGYVTESGLTKAVGNGKGSYTYTFAKALPADAKGSYTVAIEGRREVKLLPGTTKEILVRDTGRNKQMAFSVDGTLRHRVTRWSPMRNATPATARSPSTATIATTSCSAPFATTPGWLPEPRLWTSGP